MKKIKLKFIFAAVTIMLMFYFIYTLQTYRSHQQALTRCALIENPSGLSPTPQSLCYYEHRLSFWEVFFRYRKGGLTPPL